MNENLNVLSIPSKAYAVLVPNNTTFDYGDSNNYIITPTLPKPLSGSCKLFTFESPYNNIPCLAQTYIKRPSDGTFCLFISHITATNATENTGTYACVSSCPGDGYVYLHTGGAGLANNRCGTACPPVNAAITSAEVVILLRPFI